MNIRNLKPLYVDLGALGVFALLAVIAYAVGIHPVIERHRGLGLRESELKDYQATAGELSGKVAQVAAEITRIKQELSDNAIKLKSADEINSHLARLAAVTGKCGLKLDQLRPDKYLSGPRYQTVPIYLAGSGSFPECVKLLHKLQREFPDTSVASFEVSGDPSKPEEPTRLRVDLLWYAMSEQISAVSN